ncbi:NBS-LRR resistance protein, partial [Trifolium medium]|nr:NBS-LRR resistance protein [Trifolium medium]
NRFVRKCQQLTLTSASTTNTFREIGDLLSIIAYDLYENVRELQSAETTGDFEKPSVENVQDLTILPTNSKAIEIEGTSKTNNDQVSLIDDAFMKVNSNAEEQFSKSEPSPSITSPIASKFPSMPTKGDPSQKVEDLAILPTNSEIQMKQTPETEHELAILPTNSKELLNEQSLGETHTVVKPSQVNNVI